VRKRVGKDRESSKKARESGQKGGRSPKENTDLGKPDGFSPGKPNEKLTTSYQLATKNPSFCFGEVPPEGDRKR
jgi:hypothetical protein